MTVPGDKAAHVEAYYLDVPGDGWLVDPDVERVPAKWRGGPFPAPPTTIVLHRGHGKGDIAKYFQDPGRWVAMHQLDDDELDDVLRTRAKGNVRQGWLPRKVSAHFDVRRDGGVRQCVPITLQAWHGRPKNAESIGIEQQGPIDSEFPEAQQEALVKLVRLLRRYYPSLTTCLAHSDFQPHRRRDPGANFDWSRLEGLGLSGPHLKAAA